MKSFYRNKKTKELMEVFKCDFCGSFITDLGNKSYERICTISEKMERMCRRCGEEKIPKDK